MVKIGETVKLNEIPIGGTVSLNSKPKQQSIADQIWGSVAGAFNSGISQVKEGIGEMAAGKMPIEPALKVGAGVVNAVAAPLAPVLAPIGKATSPLADKLSDTKALQEYGLGSSDVPASQQTAPERLVGGIENANAILGGVAGGAKAPSIVSNASTAIKASLEQAPIKTAAREAERTAAKTLDILSPKLTAKETSEALARRGATKSGILGTIKLNADPAVQRIADTVIQHVPEFNPKKSLVENIGAVKNAVGTIAQDLKAKVVESGQDRIYSFKELASSLKGLEKPTLLVGDSEKVYTRVIQKAMEIARSNGGKVSDLFQARKEFDDFVERAIPNLYSSDAQTAMRLAIKNVRNALTDFTAEHLPEDIALRDSLTIQSRLIDAIENMSEKASSGVGKEISTNAFGRFAEQHPTVTKALKYGAVAAVGGQAVDAIQSSSR